MAVAADTLVCRMLPTRAEVFGSMVFTRPRLREDQGAEETAATLPVKVYTP